MRKNQIPTKEIQGNANKHESYREEWKRLKLAQKNKFFLENISSGEFKASGSGLEIRYGIHDNRFGQCLIATTPRGICHLSFFDEIDSKTAAERMLQREWEKAEIMGDRAATQPLHDLIFKSATWSQTKPLTLLLKGTDFQIQVWRALLQVPLGEKTTYQAIAHKIAHPKATRAVGNAISKNPIAYLIPCHRVIRQSGELGGYRWGKERKTLMLAWEANHNHV